MTAETHPRRTAAALLLAAAGLCGALSAAAQSDSAPGAAAAAAELPEIPHSDAAVTIDGVLDDAIWEQALVIELTVETSPGENVAPPVETQAYLVEDGLRLLIAFDARDPDPTAIRAYLRDRDSAFNDDFVGVVLDTFGDRRYAYEFFANALGVQMDLTNDDVNQNENESWDAIWDSAGQINDQGFAVEMAIPFSQLRFSNAPGEKTWGIDVLRFYPRGNRHRISNNALDRGRNCYLCMFGRVRGMANVEAGKNLEVVPSLTAGRTDRRPNPSTDPWQRGDTETDVGLNVRWALTQNLTANLALNPDFSQVEADIAQLNVNSQFALFFPESRPFFLEGADYFSTPIQAVFTRTVADPDFGAKLTGQAGNSQFGVFAAQDEVTNLLFPGPLTSANQSLDESNRVLVGHYARNLGGNSTIGALLTSRSGGDYSNEVAGIDGRIRITQQHSLRFQYLHSDTEYPAATSATYGQPAGKFGGDAFLVRYSFSPRDWYADWQHKSVSSGFRADSGFVTRVGTEANDIVLQRIWQRPTQKWNQISLGLEADEIRDRDGQLLDRSFSPFLNFNGPLQSYINVGGGQNKHFWDGQLYSGNGVYIFSQFRLRCGVNFSVQIRRSDQVDFANSRLGKELRLRPNIDWNINQHLLLRLQHTAVQLETQDGQSIFDADLTDLRLTWQFNVRSFLRFTTQSQVVDRNVALFRAPGTQEQTKTVGTQVLYSYKVNPQTVLYVGYSDNARDDDQLLDITRTDRTLFAKFSYAWLR